MKEYPALRNILSSLFSVQTGLDDESARLAFLRAIESDQELESEISSALIDAGIRWKEMLFNEEYEVFEAETENEARAYAAEILKH